VHISHAIVKEMHKQNSAAEERDAISHRADLLLLRLRNWIEPSLGCYPSLHSIRSLLPAAPVVMIRKEKKRKEKKRKEKKRKEKKRKEKKRGKKDYAFRRQFKEKPSIIPGCPDSSNDNNNKS